MQDTKIKGSGNSRTLASVPNFLTLYPTYEDFALALINRELPIDLGPLNPAGLDVRGTDLNKENLLKDATAALYGLGTDATPDQVLAAIKTLIATLQTNVTARGWAAGGTYTGTTTSAGTTDVTQKINLPFTPKAVLVTIDGHDWDGRSASTYTYINSGLAATGRPLKHSNNIAMEIVSGGFIVHSKKIDNYNYIQLNVGEKEFIAVG